MLQYWIQMHGVVTSFIEKPVITTIEAISHKFDCIIKLINHIRFTCQTRLTWPYKLVAWLVKLNYIPYIILISIVLTYTYLNGIIVYDISSVFKC